MTAAITTPEVSQNWQPRPALASALQTIREAIATVHPVTELGETGMVFDNILEERTVIQATPVNVTAVDGHLISERIDIRTHLPRLDGSFSDTQIAEINKMGGTGALIRDTDSSDVVLASSVALFEGDDAALQALYTPLVAWIALLHPYPLLGEDGRAFLERFCPLQEPSRWDTEDFAAAVPSLRDAGIFCNAGSSGLTAEFPWKPGNTSALLGHDTSLLTFQAGVAHPIMGNGLYFSLALPTEMSHESSIRLANDLNALESSGVDIPPLFGAWSTWEPPGRLRHTGFWPNVLYAPGIILNIVAWMHVRATIARGFIGNSQEINAGINKKEI